MDPTIISRKAGNWVDRGEPPNRTLRQVLAHYFGRPEERDAAWLEEHALAIVGMVAADGTEVHIAAYLRSVEREIGSASATGARGTAIALWHIAKAAQVRDFAERVLRGEVPVNAPTPDTLSHWLARRLLSSEELRHYEDEGQPG